jgi:hypothetical protein
MCSPLEGGGSMENLDRAARRFLEYLEGVRAATSPIAESAIPVR